MPRKPAAPPPKPSTRDEWLAAFIDELELLRPHLKSEFGVNRMAKSAAVQQYAAHPNADPKAIARALHKASK
jgi:hypothetical protein